MTDFTAKSLLERIYDHGKLVYELPDIEKIKLYCFKQVDTLWASVTRFENPHNYYVDLSQKLWDIKQDMLSRAGR